MTGMRQLEHSAFGRCDPYLLKNPSIVYYLMDMRCDASLINQIKEHHMAEEFATLALQT